MKKKKKKPLREWQRGKGDGCVDLGEVCRSVQGSSCGGEILNGGPGIGGEMSGIRRWACLKKPRIRKKSRGGGVLKGKKREGGQRRVIWVLEA